MCIEDFECLMASRYHLAMQDRVIGKKVFKIRGTISAGNFMQLPKKRNRSLGLTGRYVYIQVRFGPPRRVHML